MSETKQCKSNMVLKGISAPLNLCGRLAISVYDALAGTASFVGSQTKKTFSTVTGAPYRTESQLKQEKSADLKIISIKHQIADHKSDLEDLMLKLGEEIHHTENSEDAPATVEIIKEDIETIRRVISLLEKKHNNLTKPSPDEPAKSTTAPKPAQAAKKAAPKKETPEPKTVTKKETPKPKTAAKKETPKPKAAEKKETPKPKAAEKKETPKPKVAEKKETPKPKVAEKKDKPGEKKITKAQMSKMIKTELVKLAKGRGLDCKTSMTKDEIIKSIIKSYK